MLSSIDILSDMGTCYIQVYPEYRIPVIPAKAGIQFITKNSK
jgi:hypothetical protein